MEDFPNTNMGSAGQVAPLLQKFLNGDMLSENEMLILEHWKANSLENRALFDSLADPSAIRDMLQKWHAIEINRELNKQRGARMLTEKMLQVNKPAYEKQSQTGTAETDPMRPSPGNPVHRVHFLRHAWFRYAAVVCITLGVAAYFLLPALRQKPILAVHQEKDTLNDIQPGNDKAILTLSNGKQVELNNHSTSETINDGSISISNNNGELSYKDAQVYAINTMSTPKGGQYQLTLADGTRVWLNAASSITYPTVFTNNTREVKITGEAYFEVAKNAGKSFKVIVNGMEVEVLGTHFNINAYDDEAAIKTTLFEGAVKVIKGTSQERLKPGQQAQLDRKNTLKVINDVDTGMEIAWKNSEFNFKNTDLKTVMRQLARWYDLEVVYEDGAPVNRRFDGEIPMDISLLQVINSLEKYDVHFRLEGRKLIVLP